MSRRCEVEVKIAPLLLVAAWVTGREFSECFSRDCIWRSEVRVLRKAIRHAQVVRGLDRVQSSLKNCGWLKS